MTPTKEQFVFEIRKRLVYKNRKARYDADGYRCDTIRRMKKIRNRRNIRTKGCYE